MEIDSSTLKFIQDNVPEAKETEIQHAYTKYEGNILEVISFLMNIPQKEVPEKTEWEKRREIYDMYDGKMQEMLQQQKELLRQQQETKPST